MVSTLTVLAAFIFLFELPQISMTCQTPERPEVLRSNGQRKSDRLAFRMLMSEKGEEGGILTSRALYTATDGTRVSRTGEIYPSSASASERMGVQLKEAVKIIERTVLFEGKRKVGERVLAEFGPANKDLERFAVLSNRHEVVTRIESSSLEHLLAFERFEKRDDDD